MPTDGSGVHTLPAGYLAVTGDVIQPSQHNPPLEDLSAAATARLMRNGSNGMTADLPMGGNKIVSVADPTNAQDAATKAYVDARYRLGSRQIFTASGTWTRPTACRAIQFQMVGGGGGGGGVDNTSSGHYGVGGGGGAGETVIHFIENPSASYSVVIGSGGAGGVATGGSGGVTTSFGALTALGGGGGSSLASNTLTVLTAGGSGGSGGAGTVDVRFPGQPGAMGVAVSTGRLISGDGGPSSLGGGAQGRNVASANGLTPTGYGGGGSGGARAGAVATSNGGAGAPGVVIVWEYY